MVESTGSLYVMSPERFPLVVFGDTSLDGREEWGVGRAGRRLIDPPPSFNRNHNHPSPHSPSPPRNAEGEVGEDNSEYDLPPSLDSITRFMKRKRLRQMCADPSIARTDKRCLVGVRKVEGEGVGVRFGGLVGGVPGVGMPPGMGLLPAGVEVNAGSSAVLGAAGGKAHVGGGGKGVEGGQSNRSLGGGSTREGIVGPAGVGIARVGDAEIGDAYTLGAILVTILMAVVLGYVVRGRRGTSRQTTLAAQSKEEEQVGVKGNGVGSTVEGKGEEVVVVKSGVEVHLSDVPPPSSHTQSTSTFSTSPSIPSSSSSPLPPPTPATPSTPTPKPRSRKVSFGDALKTDGEDAEPDDDSYENDDPNEQDQDQEEQDTRKKKPVRRRRGKKKPKAIVVNGVNGGGEEKENGGSGSGGGSGMNGSATGIVLSTPKVVTPSASLVVSEDILGFGSHGTVVFKGSLQGRAVAVKRLLRDFVTLASREVSVLQESDDHPNVIRYYYQESHANFLYIALELCPASLADVIERPDMFREIVVAFEPKRALRQVTAGLRHLHGLKIIHRDIKPQNILISHAKPGANANGVAGGHRMLISDFGLCKKLEVDQTSFYPTAHGAMAAGTVGWRAPEILRGDVSLDSANSSGSLGGVAGEESQSSRGSAYGSDVGTPTGRLTRLTKSVDVFALGCLYYYVLTNGGHPFGDRYERDVNILKGAKCLDGLERFGEEGSEAVDVITKMLSPEARERPDTSTCLLHPYFWDPGKRLNFLQEASDRFEIMCRDPRDPLLVELERGAFGVVGNDWNARLDKWFIETLGKYRKYDGKSVQDLMRALRNKKHHYQDLPDNVKRQVGSMPEGFLAYFTKHFPKLFLHVHQVIASSQLRTESQFRTYFEHSE
ncbi:kinase-like domain-containing protein [Irpex lacteus]|nr:kinase-like domain-containing protein [Irpex lacteus]